MPSTTIEGPYALRQARLVSIRLSPLQYDPGTGMLRRLSTGTLIIRRKPLSGPALARLAVAPPDPAL